jgi:ABC-type branched-subunit amino acid transport system substrate-binding protein
LHKVGLKEYGKNNLLTRRELLVLAGSVALLGARRKAPARALRIGLLIPALRGGESGGATDISAGAALARSEADRAATLFGQNIHLDVARITPSDEGGANAAHRLITNGATVLIGGISVPHSVALARVTDDKNVVLLNVGSTADSLRRDQCRPHMFHVIASDEMIAAARSAVSVSNNAPVAIELWHSSLEKYGGSQLNDRYHARFGRGMTSSAWAGWVAVKIAWDAALRARSVEGPALVAFLVKDGSQFDGHKGAPLSFRPWDHQLRQPLYAVSNNRVIAELPDVGKLTGESMQEELDKFGDSSRKRMCIPR